MAYNPQKKVTGRKVSDKGFTLIEMIMVIMIITILSVSGAYLMLYLIQNSVFIPNQLNMDMAASDALDIMIEGDQQAKGLRFSRAVTNIQDYQVTFINQNNQSIRYRLDTGINKLYRSVNGGAEAFIPYYVNSGMNITGKGNKLFSYYDANETVTANPANVRWITMTMIARTGAGSYANWEGQSDKTSSVAVKKFQ